MCTILSLLVSILFVCSLPHISALERSSAPLPPYSRQNVAGSTFDLFTADSAPLDVAVSGPMEFYPNLFSGTALPLSTRPDFTVDFNIMLPNSLDDFTSCNKVPFHSTNDYNQSFAGAFIVVMTQACTDLTIVLASKPAGIILRGCPPEAPYNCDAILQMAVIRVPLTVPVFVVSAANGIKIVNYLNAKQQAAVSGGGFAPTNTLQMSAVSTGPIDPAERTALISIMDQMTFGPLALGAIVDVLPLWSKARFSDMTKDPCRDRVRGIWCEKGRIVVINIFYQGALTPTTGPPVEFGVFTELRALIVVNNAWRGPIPDSFCNLTKLRSFSVSTQQVAPGVTALPNCDWPLLEDLQIQANSVSQLPPKFSTWTKLRIFMADHSPLTSLPSLANLDKLEWFDLTSNKLTGSIPTFHPSAPLQVVSFATNKLTGTIPTNIFDGRKTLQYLDLNSNRFEGPLPTMTGCVNLKIVDFSSQRDLSVATSIGMSGTVPTSWYQFQQLQKLYLQENSLVSPVSFTTLRSLTLLDLSNNFFTVIPPLTVGFFVSGNVGSSLTTLKLAHNQLKGAFGFPSPNAFTFLKELDLSYNQITTLWTELFVTAVIRMDLSHNNLTTTPLFLKGFPQATFEKLNLQHNPSLQLGDLPPYMFPQSIRTQDAGSAYSCALLQASTAPIMVIAVDPLFHSYKYCDCLPGNMGRPPLCHALPNYAELNPYEIISSSDVGDTFADLLKRTGGVGSQLEVIQMENATDIDTNSTVTDPTDPIIDRVVSAPLYSQSFSDSMYGEFRLTQGLSTAWVINLKSLYQTDIETRGEDGDATIVPGTVRTYKLDEPELVAANAGSITPVRVITIRLHLSSTRFISFDDVISVYSGSEDLKGERIATIRGTDEKPEQRESDFTMTPEYILQHNSSLSKMDDPRLIEVQVFSNEATVQFQSRDTDGLHMYATYSYDFTCPEGYFYDRYTSPSGIPICRTNRLLYQVSSGVRSAVYAISALALGLIALVGCVLAWHWNSMVFKAASRSFMALILCLLVGMALGALCYAAVPSPYTSTGDAICIGRAWLSCLPLSGILAVILAKMTRLNSIFNSKALQVKSQSDTDILLFVLVVCALQSAMLSIFSGLPLSRATLELGHGSQSDQLVAQCNQLSGFMSWIGAEIAFVGCLILPAAYLGFKTRDLPSQYNESTHIQNALILLLFFGVIIVPLDIFIQDNPEAAVLIQGLGQAFLCIILLAIIFFPKLYYLFTALDPKSNAFNNTRLEKNTVMSEGSGNSNTPHLKSSVIPRTSVISSTAIHAQTPGSHVRPLPVTTRPMNTNGTEKTKSPTPKSPSRDLDSVKLQIDGNTTGATREPQTPQPGEPSTSTSRHMDTGIPIARESAPSVSVPAPVIALSPVVTPASPRRVIKIHAPANSEHHQSGLLPSTTSGI